MSKLAYSDRDLNNLKDSQCTVQLSGIDALSLLGIIQLALRHPKNTGPASRIAREFANRLQEHISSVAPGLKELCEMGWDPRHDVEP